MAKRSTILLALLASVCTVSAQNLEMLSGDPQWMYARYRNNEFESAEPNAQIDDVRNGFLETGGRKYHKLFQVDRLDIDDGNTLYALVEPIGVREDNGRVYVFYDDYQKQVARLCQYELNAVSIPYQQTSDSELLLYDFTLQVGDRYPTSEAYDDIFVEKVECVITNNSKSRKLLTLTNGLQILEGIGCLNSRNGNLLYYLYPPEAWNYNNDLYYSLLYEYKKNGEIIYQEDNRADGIELIEKTEHIEGKFDLTGRPLTTAPQQGIYIQKGRKIYK